MPTDTNGVLSGIRCDASTRARLTSGILAAKRTGEHMDHLLIHGLPGMGKTTIARAIAQELGVALVQFTGSDLVKKSQLASLLKIPPCGAVLFIDEIHSVKREILEGVYNLMECGTLPDPRNVNSDILLFPVTVIGATTEMGDLDPALVSRFPIKLSITGYESSMLEDILNDARRGSRRAISEMTDECVSEIARRSKGSPRTAKQLMKMVSDTRYAEGDDKTPATGSDACRILNSLGVSPTGLDTTDVRILSALNRHGAMGLDNLAALVQLDSQSLRHVYEPFLVETGLVARTSGGRRITEEGKKALDCAPGIC